MTRNAFWGLCIGLCLAGTQAIAQKMESKSIKTTDKTDSISFHIDGITEGETLFTVIGGPEGRKTDMVSVRNTWWHQFIKENNYRLCVNNSFSGATICHTGYRSEDYSDRSFITRMKALGCPDIIFIFGATNDYWAKSPLGEYQYADWSKKIYILSALPCLICWIQ